MVARNLAMTNQPAAPTDVGQEITAAPVVSRQQLEVGMATKVALFCRSGSFGTHAANNPLHALVGLVVTNGCPVKARLIPSLSPATVYWNLPWPCYCRSPVP